MATRKPAYPSTKSWVPPPAAAADELRPPPADEGPDAAVAALPIVGIGASAGGLEAFEAFFRACPMDTGMAFVLVPHLDPGHVSLLTEILQRTTAMPVVEALDRIVVAANHVYIIPPNREMAILNGVLQLSMPAQVRGQRMPIDGFLRSLAEDQAERAIGIILSGTATDGTLGLRAIHGAGGVGMVQEPATAKYDGMPQSAIAAGYATHILPVEEMPAALREILRLSVYRQSIPAIAPEQTQSSISRILLHLHSRTGHDFSLYKKSAIARRIERRMALQSIEDLGVYASYLEKYPDEAQKLFRDLLINVTSFFRDPESFVALKETILPPMLAGKPATYVFRVWVAGCASGEEAYSIAIVLLELLDEIRVRHEKALSIQIYATDLDQQAIVAARAGHYPPNIAQDVTPDRLHRFFVRDDTGYKVKKQIRDRVVFAVQSVIKDPPFTRLDLLSCRNVMIYLEQELQERLILMFNHALKPGGVLCLSSSESIIGQNGLFSALDRKSGFYSAMRSPASPGLPHPEWADRLPSTPLADNIPSPDTHKIRKPRNLGELIRQALLQSYAPASVITDLKGDILYVYGDTGRFLRPAPGQATFNVGDMAREGLQVELCNSIRRAATEAVPTLNRKVSVKTNHGVSTHSFSVRRLSSPRGATDFADTGPDADANLLLVSFQDAAEPIAPAGRRGARNDISPADQRRAEQLEHELAFAQANLESTIAGQQATNEELTSNIEELQSTNEEFQSSNEELATSREELQSLNEELITVNSELNTKIEQLSDIRNDMKNLLDSINTGVLFLDCKLLIRRYTPPVAKIYRLIASDIGRPLADIKSNLGADELLPDLQTVLDTLIPIEREVCALDGAWYLVRMQPYRTLDNVIAGVVLTVTTVTDFKHASEAVQRSEERYRSVVTAMSEGLVFQDANGAIVACNPSAERILGLTFSQLQGRTSTDPRWHAIHEDGSPFPGETHPAIVSLRTGEPVVQTTMGIAKPDGSLTWICINAEPLRESPDAPPHAVLTTFRDITGSRQTEELLRDAEHIKLGVAQLARELAEGIVNTITEPLLVLDGALQVVSAIRSFFSHFRVTPDETVGRKIYDLGNGQWNIPSLRDLLENILPHDQVMENYRVEHDFPGLGPRRMVLNARRIVTAIGNTELILLAMVAVEPLMPMPATPGSTGS